MTRAERLHLGVPVCTTPTCGFAPDVSRNGKPRKYCRSCASASPDRRGHPRNLGPSEPFLVLFPIPLLGEARRRAHGERLSAAEWIRRAVARALGTPP